MSDEEVKHFFINKKEDERVCGRFKQTQLHRIVIELPQYIFSIQMPWWKKFLVACLVVFSTTLFSCETKIRDKVATNRETIELTGVMIFQPDTIHKPPPPPPPDASVGVVFCPPIMKGDVEMVEIEPTPSIGITALNPVRDTTYGNFTEEPLKPGLPVTAVKTKNPPKADSINCNTIKNYY
jgi:hypothetical protein